jgi:exodeoxyribonuclease V alpha subunit
VFLLDKSQKTVRFDWDDERLLFDWAYALTVHKSQGSEYLHCIITVQQAHCNVNRNLLYTAVTRAKKGVVIVGEQTAVDRAILTTAAQKESGLKKLLNEYKKETKND